MKRAMQRRAWLVSYWRSALRPSAEILTCCEMRSRRTWAPSDSSARTESSRPSRGSTCAMCLRAIITLFLRRFSLSSRAASFWRCTIDRSKPCSDDDDSRDRDDADESDSRRRPAEYRALLRGEAIIPRIDRVRVRAIESAIIASVTEFQPQLLVVAFFSCSLITSPSVRPLSSLDSMVTLADAASRSLCRPGTRRVSAAGERCWWQRFYPGNATKTTGLHTDREPSSRPIWPQQKGGVSIKLRSGRPRSKQGQTQRPRQTDNYVVIIEQDVMAAWGKKKTKHKNEQQLVPETEKSQKNREKERQLRSPWLLP